MKTALTYGADETPKGSWGISDGTTWLHLGSRIPPEALDTNLELSNSWAAQDRASFPTNKGRATASIHLVAGVCEGRESAILSAGNKLLFLS